ncbi:MAG TPA: long-chain-fatty-acid--CoA ligase [Sneathiellales bacterium]|jgi:fatty-acyl-CoA synthase|nr:long-chain-fatty-acid--CoA ligase [Sneathiellales bacterium]
MRGLMQSKQLLISSIIEHAAKFHGNTEIVSRTVEGPIHRYGYRELCARSKKLANALERLGCELGDVVGTLAWNGYRHMEIYYGVSGTGTVCHTVNPRLFPEQIVYIINHAEDKYIFLDLTFVALIEGIADQLPRVAGFIIMTDEADMPETTLPNAVCYETLISAESDDYKWPQFDENTASSLCYTSGTTGNPKGVLYSHRSTVLHCYTGGLVDTLGFGARDTVLPVVPMFHANSWGIAYLAPMVGAKLVMPGKDLDGASVYELLHSEGVTFTAGVPTVWLMLLQYMEETGQRLDTLKASVIGGSAAPRSMIETFQNKYGVQVLHAWGMTEMSPLGTIGTLTARQEGWSVEEKIELQSKQGRGIFGVELKIVDDDGADLPWDGKTFGRLLVRGAFVAEGYFKGEGADAFDEDGWFDTGDVSTFDEYGFMQITDRSKDVIKSGGEWISSIDIENVAVGHPGVAEAAVIGIEHPKWDERPLLIIVRAQDTEVSREDLLQFFNGKIAKWCVPDDVVFVEAIPHTATGKIQKVELREQFKGYVLPTVSAAE